MQKSFLATPVAVVALAFLLAFVGVVKSESNRLARSAASAPAAGTRIMALADAEQQAPKVDAGAPGTTSIDGGQHIALVIGNARYPDDDAALKQPVRDARAVADELRARGFDIVFGENLTRQGMQDALASFTARITAGSTALMFFSGYGVQSGRQSYMVPVDAQIWREADVRHDGIAIDPVVADMDAHGASVKLVVIDASRRNPFERRFRGLSIGLAPITTPEGALVIYASAPGQVARDEEGDRSLFVTEFIQQIRSQGSSAEDIFNRTRVGVARASNGARVPGVFSTLIEDVYLAPSKTAPARQSSR
jgi:uncharacterized caspase-like protein